ncbi:hypothetical protein RRG08_001176, partial [Elysia crispata]
MRQSLTSQVAAYGGLGLRIYGKYDRNRQSVFRIYFDDLMK